MYPRRAAGRKGQIMQWNKYTIHTVPGAEEAVSALLLELGVEGVEIEDGRPLSEEDFNELFIDLLPELAPDDLPPDDGTARVIFYLRTEAGESAAGGRRPGRLLYDP